MERKIAGKPGYELKPSEKNPKVRRWMKIGERAEDIETKKPGGLKVRSRDGGEKKEAPRLRELTGDLLEGFDLPDSSPFKRMLASLNDARVFKAPLVRAPTVVSLPFMRPIVVLPQNYQKRISGKVRDQSYPPRMRRLSQKEILRRDIIQAAAASWQMKKGLLDPLSGFTKIAKDMRPFLYFDRSADPRLVKAFDAGPHRAFGALVEMAMFEPEKFKKFVEEWGVSKTPQKVTLDYPAKYTEDVMIYFADTIERAMDELFGFPAVSSLAYKAFKPEDYITDPEKDPRWKIKEAPKDLSKWKGGNDHLIREHLSEVKVGVNPFTFVNRDLTKVSRALLANSKKMALHETPYVKHPKVRRFLEALAEKNPEAFDAARNTVVVFADKNSKYLKHAPYFFWMGNVLEGWKKEGRIGGQVPSDVYSQTVPKLAGKGRNGIVVHAGDAQMFKKAGKVDYKTKDIPYIEFLHELAHAIDFGDSRVPLETKTIKVLMGGGKGIAGKVTGAVKGLAKLNRVSKQLAKLAKSTKDERIEYAASTPFEIPSVVVELAFSKPDLAKKMMEIPEVKEVVDGVFGFDPVEVMSGD